MGKVKINPDSLTNIANTIRNCLGTSDTMTVTEMPDMIEEIYRDTIQDPITLIDRHADRITKIEIAVFSNCTDIVSVYLPKATSIGDRCFYYCTKLTSIDLPKATTLGYRCFYNCTSLSTIDLPLVTSLGDRCFNGCANLSSVYLRSSTVATISNTTNFIPTTSTIYVPSDLLETYKTTYSALSSQFAAI